MRPQAFAHAMLRDAATPQRDARLRQRLAYDDRQSRFVDEVMRDMRRVMGDFAAEQYNRAGRLDCSYQGLARYWRKRSP